MLGLRMSPTRYLKLQLNWRGEDYLPGAVSGAASSFGLVVGGIASTPVAPKLLR